MKGTCKAIQFRCAFTNSNSYHRKPNEYRSTRFTKNPRSRLFIYDEPSEKCHKYDFRSDLSIRASSVVGTSTIGFA